MPNGTRKQPRTQWGPWLLALCAFLPVVVLRAGILAESDTFWQVRTGLLTLDTGALPQADTFSWTASGAPWQAHSWAFNVVLGLAYRGAGLAGVALVCMALTLAAAAAVLALLRTRGVTPLPAAVAIVASAPLVIAWYSARPQAVDYVAMPVLLLLLDRLPRGRSAAPTLIGIAALMCLWVNLHEAALLGIAIAGAHAVLRAVFRANRTVVVRSALAAGVAVIGSLANPWGASVLLRAGDVAAASTTVILEWQRPDPTDPVTLVALLLGALALWRAVRTRDALYVAAVGVTLAGTLTAQRILPILVLVSLPMVMGVGTHPRITTYLRSRRAVFVPGLIVGELAFAVVAAPSLMHIGQPDPEVYSPTVVAAIPSGCRVYNEYLLGGYVILERPDVLVSVDSRNDLYGVDAVLDNARVIAGRADHGVALRGAGCVLIAPASGLATALRSDPAWAVSAEDATAALFVRAQR